MMIQRIYDWKNKKKEWNNWKNAAFAGAIFLLPFSFQGFSLALSLAILFMIFEIWQKNEWSLSITLFDGLVLLFLGWSFFGTMISLQSSMGLFIQSGLIPACSYFVMSRQIMSEENRRSFLQMIWLGAAFVAVLGLWEIFAGIAQLNEFWVDLENFSGVMVRMSGPLENPNLMAGYLAIIIAFWSGYRSCRPQKRDGILGIIGLCLLSVCLFLTYSRGAWISLFVVLIALGVWHRSKKYLFFGVFSLAVLALLSEPLVLERISSIWNPTADSSSALRLAIWHSTLYLIADYPICGIGWGAFPLVYPLYDYFLIDPKPTIYHAHNLYLHLIAEVGIVGFFIWIGIVFTLVKNLWSRVSKKESLALGVVCAIGVILLGGLTDDWLFNPKISTFFWILVGLSQCKVKNIRVVSRKKGKNCE